MQIEYFFFKPIVPIYDDIEYSKQIWANSHKD